MTISASAVETTLIHSQTPAHTHTHTETDPCTAGKLGQLRVWRVAWNLASCGAGYCHVFAYYTFAASASVNVKQNICAFVHIRGVQRERESTLYAYIAYLHKSVFIAQKLQKACDKFQPRVAESSPNCRAKVFRVPPPPPLPIQNLRI